MPTAVGVLPERRWTNPKGVTNQTKHVMLIRDTHLLFAALGAVQVLAKKADLWDEGIEKLFKDTAAIVAEQDDSRRKREELLEQLVRVVAKVEVMQFGFAKTEESVARMDGAISHYKELQDERHSLVLSGMDDLKNRSIQQDMSIDQFQAEFRSAVDREAALIGTAAVAGAAIASAVAPRKPRPRAEVVVIPTPARASPPVVLLERTGRRGSGSGTPVQEMPPLSVSAIGMPAAAIVQQSRVTYFGIEVMPETGATYRVQKRYQDFEVLKDSLVRIAPRSMIDRGFPRKHMFSCEGAKLEERRRGLEQWLKGASARPTRLVLEATLETSGGQPMQILVPNGVECGQTLAVTAAPVVGQAARRMFWLEPEFDFAACARADLVEKRKQTETELEVQLVKRSIEKLRWEEERKTIERRGEEERKSDDHSTQKHHERVAFETAQKKAADQELLGQQEESNMRQQAQKHKDEKELLELRLQSDERRAELGLQEAVERAKIEEEGKIKAARENEDVNTRMMKAEQAEKRAQMLAGIEATAKIATDWISTVFNSPYNLALLIGSIVACLGGIYLVREMAILLREQLNKRLGRPSLVRMTNRRGGMQEFGIAILRLLRLRPPRGAEFNDVVLHPKLKQQVMRLADATSSAKRRRMPLQHAMFYGPPGTGKTMVAQRFAEYSGLEYAIMSGGDVAPLEEQAVTELHKLFRWVHRSKRGVLLFIDEADAFLASRKNSGMSESLRNALTTMLYHTGRLLNRRGLTSESVSLELSLFRACAEESDRETLADVVVCPLL
ncbi:atad-3 [Symbiodinium sp. KB8]|nr:atad-3 [Symbiodinium sp. KB8]